MRVSLDQIQLSPPVFQRPECLLCCASGDMFASHKGAGVLHVRANGEHRVLGKKPGLTDTEHFLPNGIALATDGTLFIATDITELQVIDDHPDTGVTFEQTIVKTFLSQSYDTSDSPLNSRSSAPKSVHTSAMICWQRVRIGSVSAPRRYLVVKTK